MERISRDEYVGDREADRLCPEADAVVLGTRVCYPPTFERINSKKKTKGPAYTLTCTQFTVAQESIVPEFRKQIILEASDGALSTLKSPFNDDIADSDLWGSLYDGRAVVGPIHEKFLAGASLDECRRELHEDHSPEEATRLINTWA